MAPTFIQHHSHRTQNADAQIASISPFQYNCPLVDPSLPGNCLIMGLSYPTGKTIASVIDDQSQAWTLAKSQDSGAIVSEVWYKLNTVAGARMVTVTFNQTTNGMQAVLSEFAFVASASAVDVTSGNSASSGTITAGSLTPTVDGDLIYNYGMDNADNFNNLAPFATVYNPGANFTLLSAGLNTGIFAQYTVQAKAAAVNPTLSIPGGTKAYNSVAVAFKAGTSGTLPAPGIRIAKIHHFSSTSVRTPFSEHFPTTGNLILLCSTMTTDANGSITAVSDTAGNQWTNRSPGGHNNNLWEGRGGIPSSQNVITLTVSFGATSEAHCILYDVVGAAAMSYDHYETRTATESGNADGTPAPNFTPVVTNGLVVNVYTNGTGPPSGMVTTGGFCFDSVWYTGQDDQVSNWDAGDAYAHIYPKSLGQITFTFHENNGGVNQEYIGTAHSFTAAPVPGRKASRAQRVEGSYW